MTYNLVPPFLMRETGIIVRDTPKIHMEIPTEEDHAISFPDTGFRIPISLTGTFSFFPTTKPSASDLIDPEEVYILTLATCNPHLNVYARNEESMLDWDGNLKPKNEREFKIVLDDVPEDDVEMASLVVSSAESAQIDAAMADEIQIQYDSLSLDEALFQRGWKGDFKVSIGSTYATDHEYLLPTPVTDSEASSSDDSFEVSDSDTVEWDIDATESELDDFMAAAIDTSKRGVTPEYVSKVRRISFEDATRTIDTTSQLSVTPKNPILAKSSGTNDRMLRYKRIKEYFFMDTFYAAKHGGKSSRGHTCCQLFVTDKGFAYVVPMRSKGETPLKWIALTLNPGVSEPGD
jgi:hypothetical protein